MGKTFVFNIAEPFVPEPGSFRLTHGLFFDGTLNNRRNTEIRKKVEKADEYKDSVATAQEKEIYKKYAKDDNSFGNDFTNVARKYMCCEKNSYAIYVEGIGTTDEKSDSMGGYVWGRGATGIIEKVRSGCKKLANKIQETINDKNKITTITVTVDVFGFSRGASAARNFLYNLQKTAYVPEVFFSPIEGDKAIDIDHNGYSIKPGWLKDGKLPAFGHLGTALLDIGIEREIVDNLRIRVRFLGIHDTVASYDPENLIPRFKKYVKELHLHELGALQKAVHFIAMDEHRNNFSLTRLEQGIEKEFPGVHSDIGGSYNTGIERIKEIENAHHKPGIRLEQYR